MHAPEGVVSDVVGLIVEVGGLSAAVGDTLRVHDASGARLDVEVVGFRGGSLLTTPLGPLVGIGRKPTARRARRPVAVPLPVDPDEEVEMAETTRSSLHQHSKPTWLSSRRV